MNVLSFNLRIDLPQDGSQGWKFRRPSVVSFLNDSDYDVIGIQECTPAMTGDLEENFWRFKRLGVPRCGEEELCPILYDARKLRLLASGTFWLSPTPDVPSKFPDSFFHRICTWAEFASGSGSPFRVFNTHLDYANSGVQVRQMGVLLDRLKTMDRKDPLPVVLTGDFNAEPDAAVHRIVRETVLKKKRELSSLYEGTCRTGLTFHGFHGTTAGFPIDYIYFSRDLIPVSGRIVTEHEENGPWLSDHFPVEARFR